MPAATGTSYSVANVCKGFIANGQLDAKSTIVPLYQNLLHTYRGNIEGTCLENEKFLIDTFLESMYFYGSIDETIFNEHDIPKDVNSKGEVVLKTNSTTMENCHHAKVLTSFNQVTECCKLIDSIRMKEYNLERSHYKSELEDVNLNATCKGKFIQMVIKSHPELGSQNSDTVEFETIRSHLTEQLLKDNIAGVYKDKLRAFVRVCSRHLVRRSKVYYVDVPGTKPELIKHCFELVNTPYSACLYSDGPVLLQLLRTCDEE